MKLIFDETEQVMLRNQKNVKLKNGVKVGIISKDKTDIRIYLDKKIFYKLSVDNLLEIIEELKKMKSEKNIKQKSPENPLYKIFPKFMKKRDEDLIKINFPKAIYKITVEKYNDLNKRNPDENNRIIK
jgi:hypothetical protein